MDVGSIVLGLFAAMSVAVVVFAFYCAIKATNEMLEDM